MPMVSEAIARPTARSAKCRMNQPAEGQVRGTLSVRNPLTIRWFGFYIIVRSRWRDAFGGSPGDCAARKQSSIQRATVIIVTVNRLGISAAAGRDRPGN